VTRALIPLLLIALTRAAFAQAPVTPTTPVKPEQEGNVPAQPPVTTPTPAPVTTPMPAPPVRTPTQAAAAKPTSSATPDIATDATCLPLDLTPGALLDIPAGSELELATPIPWSEFVVAGNLVDRREVVHALLEPTMRQLRTSLSIATLPQVAALTARFGYQLVRYDTIDMPKGARLVLELAPLPLVRRVDVSIDQSLFDKLLEDDVRRRIGLRPGAYLPWEPIRRQCAMLEERRRIEEFLHDEGYFGDRSPTAPPQVEVYAALAKTSATININVRLGPQFTLGDISIACPPGYERRKGRCLDPVTNAPYMLAVTEDEIKDIFEHEQCMLAIACIGKARFTRTQFQKDLDTLRALFHKRGYPAVRITSSELRESFDRKHNEVNPRLTIDPRRQVDIQFEGHDRDRITDDQLRKQLTYYDAGSADDVETAESARAITTYLQTRGFFDARVTWTRERHDVEPRPGSTEFGLHFDKIVFRIDMGDRRRVENVEFLPPEKDRHLKDADLRKLLATKEGSVGGSFLGTVASATSPDLIADQERIKEAYRRVGHPDVRVGTSVSPNAAGLGNAALTAALLGVDTGNDLHVRFTIDEGPPTLLTRLVVQLDGGGQPSSALCAEVLGELARELVNPKIALPTDKNKCATTIQDFEFRADDVAATRDRLREALFKNGRARTHVEYAAVPIGPQRIEARYTIRDIDQLKLGKVIIRGNFRTANSIIYNELDFDEGDLLTTDRLANGARKLRNMGLFETVNLDMPDLDCPEGLQCSSETINAVIRVEERYDHWAEIGVEGGYSSNNGPFGTLRPIWPNILGRGLRFEVSGTYGTKLQEVDARFRIPPYLMPPAPLNFSLDFTALYRVQDTPRFGVLSTRGLGVAASRTWWQRQPTEKHSAASITGGPFYEFRLRSRNVDALRPIGADMDESQVAISTRTGAVGWRMELENRVLRSGQLSPLAPEKGWHAEVVGSFASPRLYGQDKFVKLSASLSKFQPLGKYIVLRADARYDHGIPLGGAVLLPEVERFFAGGDNTVRGYADDRMETEIIQVAVPPLDNVSQIRVIPANRNIRALGSLDGQAQIWKIFAGALFVDAGLLTNQWSTVTLDDVRPSVGMGLRALTPFGIGALEYAIPLRPRLGDDPRGRIHFYFAARAQF
jgi:outer membrane protein insertion porin family